MSAKKEIAEATTIRLRTAKRIPKNWKESGDCLNVR